MNIWFAANIPPQSNGGVARSMQGLAAGLRMLGHRTTIVTNALRKGNGYLVFALQLAGRLLLTINKPPDWIIARSTDGVACALLIKAFSLKTRMAIHNHGWEEHVYEIEKRLPGSLVHPHTTWKARMVRFPLLRACLALSDCCVCGTISEIRWLKKKYPRYYHKFRYAPNGVHVLDRGFWVGRDDVPLNILAIGSMTWKKNVNHTIAVFEEIVRHWPQSRLFIIGAGLNKNDLPCQLPKEITFVPEVRSDAMTRLYTTCPYLISSSRYEGGHSFAIVEAMSYGCVVFASEISSTMEILRDNYNGFLITGADVSEDATIISTALKEKDLLAALRRHAFCSARRNRWERQTRRLERILCLNR
jgi:glycosyltransferase involved in cell wall biosynthesis